MVRRELLVEQPRRSARLDVVAERLEQPRRLDDRFDEVGRDRHTIASTDSTFPMRRPSGASSMVVA
jgi:hypothetical protein